MICSLNRSIEFRSWQVTYACLFAAMSVSVVLRISTINRSSRFSFCSSRYRSRCIRSFFSILHSELPSFHWMLFLDFFSRMPMPSSTFVMS